MTAAQHAAADRLDTEPPRCPLNRCSPTEHGVPIASGWDFEYATTTQEFPIHRCPQCGLVFLRDVPVQAELPRIYPPNYYSFSDSTTQSAPVRIVRERLERRKVRDYEHLVGRDLASVVDIGCGDGRMLDILRRFAPSGWRLAGVEFGGAAAELAASKGYDIRAGDFEQLDCRDWEGSFDLALMHQVLEHTRAPRDVLSKTRSLLRPGGILSVETPDVDGWDFHLFRNRYWGGYHIPRHFYLFSKATLTEVARDCGFEILQVRSILSPMFWVHSIHNWCADHPAAHRLAGWFTSKNIALLGLVTVVEVFQTRLTGRSSNLQVLLRRV